MSIFDIRVQKLFLITIGLKVISSALGWYFQSPWILGLWVPLAIMAAYIWIGSKRNDRDVSDEKFADSAYYLGFIFTITSIIFSLFDLPNIGTRIQDIAVRFGAAMVSTVFGLLVRVYLVSFRTDVADAMRNAEDALLGATQTFTDRLTMALERLQDFESRVDLAAQASIERVNMQVENLSKNHADKLTEFFTDLTNRNQEAFTTALTEVRNASVRLAFSVDKYSTGMKDNLSSIEEKVSMFATAVTERLQNTTFPDDYFERHLQSPMAQLESAATDIAQQVNGACQEMSKAVKTLGTSLKKVQAQSGEAEKSMDSILKLTGQQHLILETAQGQLGTLEKLTERLSTFDQLLNNTMTELAANNSTTEALRAQVAKMTTESVDGRNALERSLSGVTAELSEYRGATAKFVEHMNTTISSTAGISARLEQAATSQLTIAKSLQESATLAVTVAAKYDAVSMEAGKASADLIAAVGDRTDKSLSKIGEAVQALQDLVRHVSDLSTTLRSHGDSPNSTIGHIVSPRGPSFSPTQNIQGTEKILPAVAKNTAPTTNLGLSTGTDTSLASQSASGQSTFRSMPLATPYSSESPNTDTSAITATGNQMASLGVDKHLAPEYPAGTEEQKPPTAQV